MTLPHQVGAQISKQAASISSASLKRQEEVLPMAKLEQWRYNIKNDSARFRTIRRFFERFFTSLKCGGSLVPQGLSAYP